MIKKSVLLIIILAGFYGCTRDDICPEDTPTTPLLIITFNDIADPTERKIVPGLTVETTQNNNTEVISRTGTDSIAVPLRNNFLETNYRFIRDDQGNNPNVDYVDFTYTTEDIYVNRACAFKAVYHDLEMSLDNEGSANWILQFEVLTTDVLDATETHITIFH